MKKITKNPQRKHPPQNCQLFPCCHLQDSKSAFETQSSIWKKNNKIQTIQSSKGSGSIFLLYFQTGSPASVKPIPCYLVVNVRISNQIQLCFPHISESTLLSHALGFVWKAWSFRKESVITFLVVEWWSSALVIAILCFLGSLSSHAGARGALYKVRFF